MTEEHAVTSKAIGCSVTDNGLSFHVSAGPEFKDWISSRQMTTKNKFVGQMNREWLLNKLEAWINENSI